MPLSATIVGGGIVGLATAYRLLERLPSARVVVLEKEAAVGQHQSSHNSGVLHCGLYYKPGSRRARLAVRGIQQMVEFCQQHSVPHEVCGKVVVAASQDEVPRLNGLFERGQQNGLNDLRMPPGNRLEALKRDRAGQHSIRVNSQYRICFIWNEDGAHEVEIADYH